MNFVTPIDPSQTTGLTPAPSSELPESFAMFPDGIYFVPPEETAAPVFVSSLLRVVGTYSDAGNKGWGTLVSVRAPDGTWHDIPLSNRLLTVKPTDALGLLIDHGLVLGPDKKSKERLLDLLRSWKSEARMIATGHGGWTDSSQSSFILGRTVVGSGSFVPLSMTSGPAHAIQTKGTAEAWRLELGAKCSGNPLMVLAVSLAFSGPLLEVFGLSGGGLHFRGASSTGKTTLLNLAASVWGSRTLITQWRATSNGLEAIAPALNGLLLPLDEIAEISARDLHDAIYMLANGTGKARMTKDATLAQQTRWRLALISSGEISISEKLREARLDVKAGHEVRLIDVEADGRVFGAFDLLHGAPDAATFANMIQRNTREQFGTVGARFVEGLIKVLSAGKADVLERAMRKATEKWIADLPAASDGQIERIAARFALIGTAGTVATRFGLTGWAKNEAMNAAEQAFADWYQRSYATKREAADRFVTPLRNFLSVNWKLLQDLSSTPVAGPAPDGWRDETRVFLPATIWADIFTPREAAAAAKSLADMGMLLEGEEGRLMRKAPRSIPGRPRLYTINLSKIDAYRQE